MCLKSIFFIENPKHIFKLVNKKNNYKLTLISFPYLGLCVCRRLIHKLGGKLRNEKFDFKEFY